MRFKDKESKRAFDATVRIQGKVKNKQTFRKAGVQLFRLYLPTIALRSESIGRENSKSEDSAWDHTSFIFTCLEHSRIFVNNLFNEVMGSYVSQI